VLDLCSLQAFARSRPDNTCLLHRAVPSFEHFPVSHLLGVVGSSVGSRWHGRLLRATAGSGRMTCCCLRGQPGCLGHAWGCCRCTILGHFL
jgi:hypothetical protein